MEDEKDILMTELEILKKQQMVLQEGIKSQKLENQAIRKELERYKTNVKKWHELAQDEDRSKTNIEKLQGQEFEVQEQICSLEFNIQAITRELESYKDIAKNDTGLMKVTVQDSIDIINNDTMLSKTKLEINQEAADSFIRALKQKILNRKESIDKVTKENAMLNWQLMHGSKRIYLRDFLIDFKRKHCLGRNYREFFEEKQKILAEWSFDLESFLKEFQDFLDRANKADPFPLDVSKDIKLDKKLFASKAIYCFGVLWQLYPLPLDRCTIIEEDYEQKSIELYKKST